MRMSLRRRASISAKIPSSVVPRPVGARSAGGGGGAALAALCPAGAALAPAETCAGPSYGGGAVMAAMMASFVLFGHRHSFTSFAIA